MLTAGTRHLFKTQCACLLALLWLLNEICIILSLLLFEQINVFVPQGMGCIKGVQMYPMIQGWIPRNSVVPHAPHLETHSRAGMVPQTRISGGVSPHHKNFMCLLCSYSVFHALHGFQVRGVCVALSPGFLRITLKIGSGLGTRLSKPHINGSTCVAI